MNTASVQREGQRRSARAVILIVASAGGPAALDTVLVGLPADLPAALLVLLHLQPHRESKIDLVLGRRTSLSVQMAHDGDTVRNGVAYVAPPDHHLLLNADGTLLLTETEVVHFVRPSADVLLTSAAPYPGPKYAVVLTGTGSDGADGVSAFKRGGGVVIAQDFETSDFFGMPGAAIHTGCVDHVAPLNEIAPLLISLVDRG